MSDPVSQAWTGDAADPAELAAAWPISERGGRPKCLVATVRAAAPLHCVAGDESRDCTGTLCVDVMAIPDPLPGAARLGSACMQGVRLLDPAAPPLRVDHLLPAADFGGIVLAGAFLAEQERAGAVKQPRPGDPWLVPPVEVAWRGPGCIEVELVLGHRFPEGP